MLNKEYEWILYTPAPAHKAPGITMTYTGYITFRQLFVTRAELLEQATKILRRDQAGNVKQIFPIL